MNQESSSYSPSNTFTQNRQLLIGGLFFVVAIALGSFALYWTQQGQEGEENLILKPEDTLLVTEALALSEWYGEIQTNIAQAEYEIAIVNEDLSQLQAPNRAQGFRTYFNENGIALEPRIKNAEEWSWGLELAAYGYEGALQPVADGVQSITGNRIEYQRDELTEWYVNRPNGLEQGFTLAAAPEDKNGATENLLVLAMNVTGDQYPQLSEDGHAIEFYNAQGNQTIYFGKLKVLDANNTIVPAHMVLANCEAGTLAEGCQVQLHIEDQLAAYPITIDPIATTPDWETESNQGQAYLGKFVGSAGDVNGDGYDDIILGAPFYDNGDGDEGRVFVFYGSTNGLATTADWTTDGLDAGATLGASAGTAGDVNNDGFADIIIGAPYWNSTVGSEGGKAYVFLGSATGLSSTVNWNVNSPQGGVGLGAAVGTAGDVNGDGYDDIIIGAPDHTTSLTKPGRAYVYLGDASGISTSSPWIYDYPTQYSSFAYSVSTAGDVNADGYDDVIIGTDGADEAVAFYGSASGLGSTPDWSVTGNGDSLGYAVSNAGDVNNDGFADVIIGDTLYSNGQNEEGRALVYYGSATGLYPNANWTYEFNQANTQFGYSVASAGDVNGDNYDDIIVGAAFYDNGQANEGGAFLFFGSGSGISSSPDWNC